MREMMPMMSAVPRTFASFLRTAIPTKPPFLYPEPPAPPRAVLCALLRTGAGVRGVRTLRLLMRCLRGFSWRFYGRHAFQGGGQQMILAPGLLFEVAHAVAQLLDQLVPVVVVISTSMFVSVMSIVVAMPCVLGAALVAARRGLVVAQYGVHALALADVGGGSGLYAGADRVHGDGQGFGGLGYR